MKSRPAGGEFIEHAIDFAPQKIEGLEKLLSDASGFRFLRKGGGFGHHTISLGQLESV